MKVREKKSTAEKNFPARDFHFLICDPADCTEISISGMERISCPIRCLDRAVEEKPRSIAVCFGQLPLQERENLVELCAALRRNSRTKETTVIALLGCKHRCFLESLEKAGVKYIRYAGQTVDDADLMQEVGEEDEIAYHLAMLCPYLHYRPLDAEQEICVCGAYLERMVLGGYWLHKICETWAHLVCEYFLKPRIAP